MAYESLAGYDNWKLQNTEDNRLADECGMPASVFEPNERVRVTSGRRLGEIGQVIGFNKHDDELYNICFGWDEDDNADSDLFLADEIEVVEFWN